MVSGLVVVATIVVVAALRPADPAPLDEAIGIVGDDQGFGTGLEAAERFGRVGQLLGEVAEDCTPGDALHCDGVKAAAGYARVLAAHVIRCTAPGRFEARVGFAEFLDAVVAASPGGDLPDPAGLPDCA